MTPAIDRKSSDQSGQYRIARKFAREMFGISNQAMLVALKV
jgi:hypothetical protein